MGTFMENLKTKERKKKKNTSKLLQNKTNLPCGSSVVLPSSLPLENAQICTETRVVYRREGEWEERFSTDNRNTSTYPGQQGHR